MKVDFFHGERVLAGGVTKGVPLFYLVDATKSKGRPTSKGVEYDQKSKVVVAWRN